MIIFQVWSKSRFYDSSLAHEYTNVYEADFKLERILNSYREDGYLVERDQYEFGVWKVFDRRGDLYGRYWIDTVDVTAADSNESKQYPALTDNQRRLLEIAYAGHEVNTLTMRPDDIFSLFTDLATLQAGGFIAFRRTGLETVALKITHAGAIVNEFFVHKSMADAKENEVGSAGLIKP